VSDSVRSITRTQLEPHIAHRAGRNNWLLAGSLRAGKRVPTVMSLIQSARLNGLDHWVYLKDVLERLPTHPAHWAVDLLRHRWSAAAVA
jgi:hypothetical protein